MNSITAEEDLATSSPDEAADEYFSILPNRLLVASGNAIKLYLVLTTYLHPGSPTVWPSRKTLAKALGLAKPASIDRYIKELEDLGGITVMPRYRKDGGQSSSAYRIHRARKTPERQGDGGVAQKGHPPVAQKGQLNLDTNVNLEEKTMPDAVERAPGAPEILEGQTDALDVIDTAETQWAEFWDAYPRKTAKKAARRAWDKAIKSEDPSKIIAGALAYKLDPNRDEAYTKYPSGWINEGRWDDPPLPPRRGSNGAPDRAADMFNVQLPVDADGMVTLPSGRRIPSGRIAPDQLAVS